MRATLRPAQLQLRTLPLTGRPRVERLLQSVGTFSQLMDALGKAKDSEKEDVFQV